MVSEQTLAMGWRRRIREQEHSMLKVLANRKSLRSYAVVFGLCVFWNTTADADPRSADDLKRDQEERISENYRLATEANERATQLRMDLLNQAQAFDKVRRPQIAQQKEDLRRSAELECRYVEAMRKWALQQFDQTQPRSNFDRRTQSPAQDRSERIRYNTSTEIVRFPMNMRGAIRSGRALNFLLDMLEKTATEHEILLRQIDVQGGRPAIQAQLDQFQKMLANAERIMNAAPNEDNHKAVLAIKLQHDVLQAKLEVCDMSQDLQVDPELLTQLNLEFGLGPQKMLVNLNRGDLPLDWPSFMVQNAAFEKNMRALEQGRNQAFKDLQVLNRVPVETQQKMIEAVDGLAATFEAEFRPRISVAVLGDVKATQLMTARSFMRKLRPGVYCFLEIQNFPRNKPVQFAKGSLPELLAYLSAENLQFPEATPSTEAAHKKLFEMMARYYARLLRLHDKTVNAELAVAEDQRGIRERTSEENRDVVTEIMNGSKSGFRTLPDTLFDMFKYYQDQKSKPQFPLRNPDC